MCSLHSKFQCLDSIYHCKISLPQHVKFPSLFLKMVAGHNVSTRCEEMVLLPMKRDIIALRACCSNPSQAYCKTKEHNHLFRITKHSKQKWKTHSLYNQMHGATNNTHTLLPGQRIQSCINSSMYKKGNKMKVTFQTHTIKVEMQ